MNKIFEIKKVNATGHLVITILGAKMKFRLESNTDELRNEINILKKRLIKIDNITNIKNILFYLPNYKTDLIQKYILERRQFFEQNLLRELISYLPEKGAVIADIGANIGNHTIYWAELCKAQKVYSFEPVKTIFEILQKNINLNELQNKVNLYNIGLSDKKTNAKVKNYNESNIGGTSITQDINGDLLLDKLDNINIEENKIDFIKIDTEGHEILVLEGSIETLKKYKPAIFVETGNLEGVKNILIPLGYKLKKEFENCNYLFTI